MKNGARPCTHKFGRRESRRLMSALPPEAAEERTSRQVREAPGTDIVWLADASAAHDHGSRNQAQSAERDWAIG
jgi:hypothetical protein